MRVWIKRDDQGYDVVEALGLWIAGEKIGVIQKDKVIHTDMAHVGMAFDDI